MIDVLIVDDEEPARAVLREMLARESEVRIVGECATGFEAVKAAAELKPQVIFLDVEMPKLDGFEVLELVDPQIAVVFVTAYDAYAVRAFEVHAVDYVLKPFRAERLRDALASASARVLERPEPAVLAHAARKAGEHARRIVVKDGARIHLIPTERLDYAQAQDDYVALHSEGKTYLKTQTLGSLEASLDPAVFVRIHRSFLVRLDRIRSLELYAKNSRVAILHDGVRVPVSREGHARLQELLGESGEGEA
ncbi:MAG TPA: LytTR family DNA-binding domain-containing protein [Vicinamibacteria bacterium]|nr:LytTR family DNA-binding domain-containing protein [Vicinamibacteria bacterium]